MAFCTRVGLVPAEGGEHGKAWSELAWDAQCRIYTAVCTRVGLVPTKQKRKGVQQQSPTLCRQLAQEQAGPDLIHLLYSRSPPAAWQALGGGLQALPGRKLCSAGPGSQQPPHTNYHLLN